MVEIVYGLMFRMYERHRNQAPDSGQPEIDVEKYLPIDYEDENEVAQAEFMKMWHTELFGSKNRLPRKAVEDAVTNKLYYLLQPHFIRNLTRKTFIRLMAESKPDSFVEEDLDDGQGSTIQLD